MTKLGATGSTDAVPGPLGDVVGALGLTAAPSFALMAWLSARHAPDMTICSTIPADPPINDMALMYLLMSFFHLSSWLKLLSTCLSQRGVSITPATRFTRTEGD